MSRSDADRLFTIAKTVARGHAEFFTIQGPGKGDRSTNAFMAEVRRQAAAAFGRDYSEASISGANKLAVDFYFPHEETIVEIALSLRNPTSEFERDILKALMATESGNPVRSLIFISKPGAAKRLNQPGAQAIISWANSKHGLAVSVRELAPDAA